MVKVGVRAYDEVRDGVGSSRRFKAGSRVTYPLRLFHLGRVDYLSAWRWQIETAAEVRAGADEALVLLEHLPVYTFGRRVRREHLLVDEAALRRHGSEVIESDRGGDVTFHGPGQLVAYPILNLRQRCLGPVDYVRALEETMLRALDAFELGGERVEGRPGVWLNGAKLGAIGVRVQGGVSLHGLALNVSTDLRWFEAIVPCGLSDASVTSMQQVLGFSPGVEAVADELIEAFTNVFDCHLEPLPDCSIARFPSAGELARAY
jgi:lipoate-protein ligase B